MNRLDNKVPPLVWFLLFCGLAIAIAEISGEPEERVLLEKFGDDYVAFAASVPRWLSLVPTRR